MATVVRGFLDVYAAVLARSGRRGEARALLAEITPSHPRVAYLDLDQQRRVLDILSASIAYALWPPAAPENPGRSQDAYGPKEYQDGGWSMRLAPGTWPTRHLVDYKSDLSVRDFLRDYAFRNLPVIVGGLMESWPARRCWRRDSLLKNHGTAEVEVHPSRSVVENLRQGHPPERIHLAKYLDRMASDPETYLFSGLPLSRIKGDFVEPPHFSEDTFLNNVQQREARTFFYLGGPGSGVRLPPARGGLERSGLRLQTLVPASTPRDTSVSRGRCGGARPL